YGKLREPVVRLAHWARAFGATSRSGRFLIPPTNLNTALSQAPLTASSVFNFWRPGFIPPGTTQLGQRGLLAPEFQAVDEVAVASYVNLMQATVSSGIGSDEGGAPDVNSSYAAEVQLADNPQSLVDRMNLLLFHGQMSDTLRGRISAAVNAVNIPAATGANQTQIATARLNRVKTAVFLSMISPEYLVQR